MIAVFPLTMEGEGNNKNINKKYKNNNLLTGFHYIIVNIRSLYL